MQIVLADFKGGEGFISKDTVAGGYGSRLRPFSKVTDVVSWRQAPVSRPAQRAPGLRRGAGAARRARGRRLATASSSTAMSPSCCRRSSTTGVKPPGRGDAGRGVRVGFIGLAAQKLPQLFRGGRRLHHRRRAGSGAACGWLTARLCRGSSRARQIADLDALPFPRGIVLGPSRRPRPRAVCRPAERRRVPAAGQPRAARSSAPTVRIASRRRTAAASRRQHPRRAVRSSPTPAAPFTSCFAIRCSRRIATACLALGDGSCAAGCRTRSSARRGSIGSTMTLLDDDASRRAARDELRRRVAVAGDAEEGRTAADPGGAPTGDPRALPRPRHRHGGVLRARVPRGHLGVDQRDDRLLGDARIDGGAVQDPDAVSRNAALQAHGAARSPRATGSSSTASRRRSRIRRCRTTSCNSCSARLHAVLHAAVVSGQLPAHSAPRLRRLRDRARSLASNAWYHAASSP